MQHGYIEQRDESNNTVGRGGVISILLTMVINSCILGIFYLVYFHLVLPVLNTSNITKA